MAAPTGGDSVEVERSKLEKLELDVVRDQADDLRTEIEEYEQLRSATVSTFDASSLAELAMRNAGSSGGGHLDLNLGNGCGQLRAW